MRKIFMLLVACVAMVFVSCSKDDEEDGQRGTNGERLVSKVILIETEDEREDIYKFEYDKNGQMTKVVNYYGYVTDTYTYTRSENKLIVEYLSVDEKENEKPDLYKTVCVLNNKGLITSFSDFGNEETHIVYNDKNQLINDGDCKYTWEDGNIVKVTTSNTEHTYTYSKYEKKTNISDITAIWAHFYDYSYFGAMNKNLVASKKSKYGDGREREYKYEYEFDKDGYVTVMKEYSMKNGTKILGSTTTIEYK